MVRWEHPIKGIISPSLFIPVAEESELIVDIGWWVMETACHQIAAWEHRQALNIDQPMTMSINFSSKQFFTANCLERVTNIIEKTGVNPERVKLEITEGLFMHADSLMITKLNKFRALGMRLSVDDFGTGYSSLSYLHLFPITDLKIDRVFLEQLPKDVPQTAIIEAIVLLGKKLKLNLIAEGVETDEQLTWLQSKAVDQIQGFLFSKPLSAQQLTTFLLQGVQL